MKTSMAVAACALALVLVQGPAEAGLLVKVDKAAQRMTVEVDGRIAHSWAVSTARAGYSTPSGNFRPQRMHMIWYSQKYDLSPMPHAIFFSGGYAIHGTGAVRQLGSPASHGCVRLAPANAATLYALVKSHGMAATRIQLHSEPRHPEPAIARMEQRRGTRLAQAPVAVRQSGYQLASGPIVSAYDPRFLSGQTYVRVRYVQPAYAYPGTAGRGAGPYQLRMR